MADLRPFRALRYDLERVGDLGRVVAPPYDVIPEEALPELRARSPFNVVRLTRPGGDYTGAADLERRWIQDGVLGEDAEPAFWLHEVEFDGRRRRDLIGALRLQPYQEGVVLPHERTHRGPKEDRLALLQATATSLEPLWFLYEGRNTAVPELVATAVTRSPVTHFDTPEGTKHRL